MKYITPLEIKNSIKSFEDDELISFFFIFNSLRIQIYDIEKKIINNGHFDDELSELKRQSNLIKNKINKIIESKISELISSSDKVYEENIRIFYENQIKDLVFFLKLEENIDFNKFSNEDIMELYKNTLILFKKKIEENNKNKIIDFYKEKISFFLSILKNIKSSDPTKKLKIKLKNILENIENVDNLNEEFNKILDDFFKIFKEEISFSSNLDDIIELLKEEKKKENFMTEKEKEQYANMKDIKYRLIFLDKVAVPNLFEFNQITIFN